MGIREEMLEAYDASRVALARWRDSTEDCTAEFYGGEANGLLRAVRILDKWELVAEAEWLTVYDQDQLEDGRDWALLEANVPEEYLVQLHRVKPGETIAIYRRK